MTYPNSERAQVLIEALPYIQQLCDKTVVIKYGGNAMINSDLKNAVISDIVLLSLVGIRVVVVHGGGPEISDMLKKIGKKTEFIDGLRVTDAETMEIVQMVLCGKVNKDLVAIINRMGGNAIGLCGIDGGMLKAEKLDEVHGQVGRVTAVNPKPITDAIAAGSVPVISTVAQGETCVYNINADTAAARIATALGAEKLILLTDVKGILKDPEDEKSLVSVLNVSEAPMFIADGAVSGGMIPKIECCVDAVRSGVGRAHIIDGRVPHSILIELLSDTGVGTMIL